MNSKSKIKIYKKIVKEVCEKYDGALEFITNRFTDLCSQEGTLIDEVRKCFKASLFCIKIVFFLNARLTKELKTVCILKHVKSSNHFIKAGCCMHSKTHAQFFYCFSLWCLILVKPATRIRLVKARS